MLSLGTFVRDQSKLLADLIDRRPSKSNGRDPYTFCVKDGMTLKEKILLLIDSSQVCQKCWALNHILQLITEDNTSLNIIDRIPTFFADKSNTVELSAINVTIQLLEKGIEVNKDLYFDSITKRLITVPADEYLYALKLLTPALNKTDVSDTLWNTMLQMFTLTDAHKHAASCILTFIPTDMCKITEEGFSNFFDCEIFTNNYIVQVVSRFKDVFGDEWMFLRVPEKLWELCKVNTKLRKGFVDFIGHYPGDIQMPQFYSILVECFGWCEKDHNIAINILSYADSFMKSRYTSITSCILSASKDLVSSKDFEALQRFIPLLLNTDYFLNGYETTSKFIMDELHSSNDTKFLCGLIDVMYKLHEKTTFQSIKQLIRQNFLRYTKNPDRVVKEHTVEPNMLKILASNKEGCAEVVDLAFTFFDRWRYIKKCINTLMLYPESLLVPYLKKLLTIAQRASERNPQALVDTTIEFYKFIIKKLRSEIKPHNLFKYLWLCFGESSRFDLRRLFVQVAYSLFDVLEYDVFMKSVWGSIMKYTSEEVSLVRIKVLELCLKIAIEHKDKQSEIRKFIDSYKDDKDVQVKSLLRDLECLVPHTLTTSKSVDDVANHELLLAQKKKVLTPRNTCPKDPMTSTKKVNKPVSNARGVTSNQLVRKSNSHSPLTAV